MTEIKTWPCFILKQFVILSLTLNAKINFTGMGLTQKSIGHRIAGLRKIKGLSQDELAKKIRISRPSLTQIELGNRNISIMELHQFSVFLGFSLDEFMSIDYQLKNPDIEKSETKSKKATVRVSVPSLKLGKLKNVLLYILEKCAGKPNVGETVLYKLLYFSDFNYYELYEEHLTGARYRKLPYGPVPQQLDSIINQMIDDGQLQRVKTDYHGFSQTRYLPLEKSDLTELMASEKEVIDRVIEQMSDWSASSISNYSHKDLPWVASKDGEEIDYELVFYREAPFSVRNYDDEKEES